MSEEALRDALAALDPAAVRGARWSGLGAVELAALRSVATFGFGDGSGLSIVEVVPAEPSGPTGPANEPVLLTVPSDDPLLEAPEDDQPEPPGPWRALHALAARGGSSEGSDGARLVGLPVAPDRQVPTDGPPSIRRAPGDQSHTSVVLAESAILKLYRRLPAGANPEVEILSALAAGAAEAPVPALIGAAELRLAGRTALPIAIEQAFMPAASDAFEAVAEELARGLADGGTGSLEAPAARTLLVEVGRSLADLHASLTRIGRPGFAPRPARPSERATWLRRAEDRLDLAIEVLRSAEPASAARLVAAAPALRRALASLADPALEVEVLRVHGDLHLGQILATGDGVRFVDFEGDPLREPAERLEPAPRARDVAGMLRSIEHVARSGARRATRMLGRDIGQAAEAALGRWIDDARRAFTAAYEEAGGRRALLDARLLLACETEKALLELRYAATFLPAWLYAPLEALPRLVERAEAAR